MSDQWGKLPTTANHEACCQDVRDELARMDKLAHDWQSKFERQAEHARLLFEASERYRAALEDIANHKQDSVDKTYLILQCEGYQARAKRALDADAEKAIFSEVKGAKDADADDDGRKE